jgi:putative ABC transport system ATP-binding protein
LTVSRHDTVKAGHLPSDNMTMASGAPPTLLEASGVRKVHGSGAGRLEVLHGVDLRVDAGELVMVMGPSGSGKTTLLNCLAGLDSIDGGRVLVEGEDIHAMSDARRTSHRAEHMGFVFQSFNLIPVLSAVENVELPLLILGRSPRQARSRALELLELVHLADRAGHRPPHLSGGEQQRVALARALVVEPTILWADEPTGNLDTETAGTVLDLLGDVHAEGQTLVIVTHDEAIGWSGTRLVQLDDGRVVYDGSPDDLLPAAPDDAAASPGPLRLVTS